MLGAKSSTQAMTALRQRSKRCLGFMAGVRSRERQYRSRARRCTMRQACMFE